MGLIESSIWPILTTYSVTCVFIGIVTYLNGGEITLLKYSILLLILNIILWYSEIIKEGVYLGIHTKTIEQNLLSGFLLFVFSEVLIFLTLFYSYFYNSIIPSVELGNSYPPMGIKPIPYLGMPLVGTCLLLFGSVAITAALHAFKTNNYLKILTLLIISLILNAAFTYLQVVEYYEASFSLDSGIFGSNFYTITALHGIHVILGSILLIAVIIRFLLSHFTIDSHYFPIVASTYIHFVDLVWLVVYTLFYC